jgi:hypothetical protein
MYGTDNIKFYILESKWCEIIDNLLTHPEVSYYLNFNGSWNISNNVFLV